MKALCIIAYTDYLSDARIIYQAESARQAGYVVDVITPTNPNEENKIVINQVTVHRLKTPHYDGSAGTGYVLSYMCFFIRCFLRISWLSPKKKYQLIQVCNMPDFLVFSTVIAKLMGTKIILDIHDPMALTYLAKFSGTRSTWVRRLLILQERLQRGLC